MRKLLTIFTLFTFLFASCEKEEPVAPVSDSERIYATIEKASDTKAELAQDNSDQNKTLVLWEENDEISVFVKIGEEVKNVKFVLESGAGETTGVFVKASGEISLSGATYVSAFYPYSATAVHNTNSKIISNLNASEIYTYSEETKSKAAPMSGVFSNNTISFKNIGAIVKVSTNNIPDGYNTIVLGSENNIIAGDYKISLNNSGVASVALDENGSKHITYEIGANNDIYIPIFPGTYNDMYLKAVKSASEEMTLFSTKALTAVRSTLYSTSVVLTTASSQEQLEEIIENNGSATNIHVDLGSDVNNVTIPKTEVTKAVSLTFTTDEEAINVTEGTGTDVAVQGNVNINIDSDNSTDTKKLNINLPSSTVTVAGNTTYEKIIASTADNTLILDAGTVAKLVVVEKGNIQVNAGARLESIQLDGVTSVVIIDNGGTINDAVRSVDGVTVMSKAEWDFRVLLESGNNSISVTLTEDLTITGSSININNATSIISVDFNGKTLTYTGNDVLFRTNNVTAVFRATVEGSSISAPNGFIASLSGSSKLTINGGNYSGGKSTLFEVSEGSTITVSSDGGYFTSTSADKQFFSFIDGKGTVTLRSGSYVGYDPSDILTGNYSAVYNEAEDTYNVLTGIYNAKAFNKAISSGGTGWSGIKLCTDLEIETFDLSSLTKTYVLDLNSHKLTISDSYGVYIKPINSSSSSTINIKNGEIVISESGTSNKYAAGIQIDEGDYSKMQIEFRDIKINMSNDNYSYPVNICENVSNLTKFYLVSTELEGAVAFQCWGDNNKFSITNSKLICNYITDENLGSSCVAFQNSGDIIAENNQISFSNCEFLYSGTNSYNKNIYAVSNGSNTNQITSSTNSIFGDGVTSF